MGGTLIGRPFCDRLTVSVPRSHDAALRDVGDFYGSALGGVPTSEGKWTLPMGGTFFYRVWPLAAVLEASGSALQVLREAGIFGDYLMDLGQLPIRVTRLDATLDLPERAAPVLHRLYRKATKGAVRLSRKAVDGARVVKFLSRPLYGGESLDTGTVYIPARRHARSDQYVTVYDKRQERLAKGCEDPGPLVRFEASAARGMGATLADAYDPTALFWHIVSPDIMKAPPDAPPWTPGVVSNTNPRFTGRFGSVYFTGEPGWMVT